MDRALRSLMDWYERVGVDVPELAPAPPTRRRPPSVKKPTRPSAQPAVKVSPVKDTDFNRPLSRDVAARAKTLDELRSALHNFDAGVLSDGARQAVFSRGNPAADLMIIGEAPGREEDVQGKPLIGPSGQLLDKMMAAIGLNEENFYITNVVNWRLPNNRNPKTEEIELCRPFLERHIQLANPKVLLLIGGVSMTAITGLTGIMQNHGQWQDVDIGGEVRPVLPIYHPAFLLRQPALKKDAWRDLLNLRAKLEAL